MPTTTRANALLRSRAHWIALTLIFLLVSFVAPALTTRAVEPSQAGPQGQLVFHAPGGDNAEPDLFLFDLANLGNPDIKPVNLTNTPDQQEYNPDWSPDGTQIAYQSNPTVNQKVIDVYTMRADGKERVNLTNNAESQDKRKGTTQDRDPSWVASGIAFDGINDDAFPPTPDPDPTYEIYTMSANGQNRVNLTINGLSDNHPSWSPDGTRVAFVRKQTGQGGKVQWDLWVVEVSSPGTAVNISNTSDADECFPSWSPDSNLIAYHRGSQFTCDPQEEGTIVISRGSGDIYVIGADGSNPRQITAGSASDVAPTWSPDMQYIAFASDRATPPASIQEVPKRDIYVMQSDGTGIQRVTSIKGRVGSPSWRPNPSTTPTPTPSPTAVQPTPTPTPTPVQPTNGLIVYQGDESDSGEPDLFTINSVGGTPTNLTNTPNQRERTPDWSPDGTHIAFARNLATREGENVIDIYTMRADGTGNPTQVTTDPGQDRDPSWVARGIAFDTLRPAVSSTYEIFTIAASGGNERNLTNSSSSDNHPAWSPDGTRVAFQRKFNRPNGTQWDIIVSNADNGTEMLLTNTADTDECMPTWSPDGLRLAFYAGALGACDTGGDSTVPSDIWTMNSDVVNPNLTQITNNTARNIDPAWSPDGAQIAWSSNRDGDYEIYVMQASGTNIRQLTNNQTRDVAPDWSQVSPTSSPPAQAKQAFLPLVVKP